jgi:ribose transport system substrate-binding protein
MNSFVRFFFFPLNLRLSVLSGLILWLASGLIACQGWVEVPGRPISSVTPARQTFTVAWIPKALDNPVFELGRLGAVQKAAELSASGPVQVKVLYVGSVAADAVEQVRVMEDVIARGVDAIAISCNDPTACIDPINKAVAAGIPVMTWDSDSPQSQRFTFLGVDNYHAGRTAANLLVREMGHRGKVAILTGVPGAFNLEERIRGFKDGMSAYANIQIVATVASQDDINLGVQLVEETMQAHPNLDGWFFVGMWPLFAERGSMPLWEEAALQRGMKTVAFDTLPVELELLRDGYLSGLLGQKYYWGWGYDTIQVVYDHVINGKTYPPFINSGLDIVTRGNVAAMIRAWETNDFSQLPDDPYTRDPF